MKTTKIYVEADVENYDHKLVKEGEASYGYIVAEVTAKELKRLDELKKSFLEYVGLTCEIYNRAFKAEQEAERSAKCKFQIRPGRWCGATTIVKDRCPEHRGMKNPSTQLQAYDEGMDR